MSKLLDQASEEMQVGRYGGFNPKPVMGYSRGERLEGMAR